VIDLARRLVAMPEFVENVDDNWRLKFLYDRIYQRPPGPEESELGLEFVNQTPLREAPPAAVTGNDDRGKNKPGQRNRPGANAGKKRAPLTSWEEYAQALLQANETSFVN
jgi:hypothetical protein